MFTVGYYFLPILNIKNNNINASFYIDKLVYSIKTNVNTDKITIKYMNSSEHLEQSFKSV